MTKYTPYLFIIALVVIGVLVYRGCTRDLSPIAIHDTTTVIRYHDAVKMDTVIKWYERVIYKESKPTVIYEQKVDTVFIEQTKDYDLMLHVKKKGTDLWIYAINQNGQVLKEYVYHNVGDDFSAVSQPENIFVKSARFGWNGIAPLINYRWRFTDQRWNEGRFGIGVKTGINYLERLDLSLSIENPLTTLQDTELRLQLEYNLFR